jgi:hypothetical protein
MLLPGSGERMISGKHVLTKPRHRSREWASMVW